MGNTSPHQNPELKYSYLHTYDDPHFGPCPVYRNNLSPCSFVTCVSQVYSCDNVLDLDSNIKPLMTSDMCEKIESPFLQIFDLNIKGYENSMGSKLVSTCQIPSVTFWIEFLRHSLKQFLTWRKSEQRPLTLNELTMALSKAIRAYEMTINNKMIGLSLSLQAISITIQGDMKFHPLLGKSTNTQIKTNTGYKSSHTSPLRERIVQKRAFRQQKQNLNPKMLTSNQYRYISPYLSKDSEFLGKLKKFAIQIVTESGLLLNEMRNPEQSQFIEEKQIRRFLSEFQKIKELSEAKKLIGKPRITCFYVDFAKVKHEQSEAKFSRILSEIEERSQKTDYSNHQSLSFISPQKAQSQASLRFITSQYYDYS